MAPRNVSTWLVVENQYGKALYIEKLPPGADPRMVMIRAMAKSIGLGWEIEELPGTIPIYFCRKDSRRNVVMIVERDPDEHVVGRYGGPSVNGLLLGEDHET